MSGAGTADDRDTLVRALREGDRFVVGTHEHPDGDALGSLVGVLRALRAMGKDVAAVVAPDDLPVPREYRHLALDGVGTAVPGDLGERTAILVDCGNADRVAVPALFGAARTLNVDHHHDNTRFADVDLVDAAASSTAEVLWELLPDLGVQPDAATAEALYVGLVTDTGRFMYANTGGRAHQMAADLIDAGVEPERTHRALHEGIPWGKFALLGRAVARTRLELEGRLAYVLLRRADFADSGAGDGDAEGVVDHLRALDGTLVAAVAREMPPEPGSGTVRTKVSLRSSTGLVDVSVIARAAGGGGHPQAAGFTTDLGEEETVAFLRGQVAACS